jgi:GntR family transcriptional regulator
LRYRQVYDYVLQLIDTEGLQPGDRLPSATELTGRTGVSLISVRRALDELERAGKIRRHQGVGTFVARGRIPAHPARAGELLRTLADGGGEPVLTTELLAMTVGVPSDNIVRALAISPGEPVWEIVRLRSIGTAPAILEQAVMPLRRIPALDEALLADGGSLYRYLAEQYQLTDDYVEQSLEVDTPDQRERARLGLDRREQVVRIRGVSFDASGVAFDCFQQTYRAREFVFYTAGSNNRQLLAPHDLGEWVVRPLPLSQQG